jgi:hypothetical protein
MTTPGILLTWTDVEPAEEAGFTEWYNREHVRDRVRGVPGFRRGRRFLAIDGGPKYLALYEADDIGIYSSPGYLALVQSPDARSRHFMLTFRNPIRTVARVTSRHGEGEGAFAALLHLAPADGQADRLRAALMRLLPEIMAQPSMVAAQLMETDDAARDASRAGHTRRNDRSLVWALFLEATSLENLSALRESMLGDTRLQRLGAVPGSTFDRFQMLYRVGPA